MRTFWEDPRFLAPGDLVIIDGAWDRVETVYAARERTVYVYAGDAHTLYSLPADKLVRVARVTGLRIAASQETSDFGAFLSALCGYLRKDRRP